MTADLIDTRERYAGPNALSHRRQIGVWLLFVALLVFCMVAIGGYTRLTNSGLSMVDWRPATGWLPPLTETAWQQAFDDYRQFPEYQKINRGMSMAEFQSIYLVEYAHRLFGRGLGLAFGLPFLFFLLTRRLDRPLTIRLTLLLLLGAGQGALGWFMVKSGLVDRPDVSHYRLTAHLGLAVVIFGLLLWTAFQLLIKPQPVAAPGLRRWAWIFAALVFVQILAGGLVAGLNAGLAYNSFPTMNGQWIPDGILAMQPAWLNVFENATTVQFNHRIIAYLLIAVAAFLWWQVQRASLGRGAQVALYLLLAALAAQVILGIATLLAMVPVSLGVIHQVGALVVFAAALHFVYRLAATRP